MLKCGAHLEFLFFYLFLIFLPLLSFFISFHSLLYFAPMLHPLFIMSLSLAFVLFFCFFFFYVHCLAYQTVKTYIIRVGSHSKPSIFPPATTGPPSSSLITPTDPGEKLWAGAEMLEGRLPKGCPILFEKLKDRSSEIFLLGDEASRRSAGPAIGIKETVKYTRFI